MKPALHWRIRPLLLALMASSMLFSGKAAEGQFAELVTDWPVSIQGYGLLGNRQLLRTARVLDERREPPYELTAGLLEDILHVIRGQVMSDGYLEPRLRLRTVGPEGESHTFRWVGENPPEIPRGHMASEAEIQVERGTLFYFRLISLTGVEDLLDKHPRSYFYGTDFLIRTRAFRYFTPSRLQQGKSNILSELREKGYLEARITESRTDLDPESGQVEVFLKAEAGPRFVLESWQAFLIGEAFPGSGVGLRYFLRERPGQFDLASLPEGSELVDRSDTPAPLNRPLIQDLQTSQRSHYLSQGYPDVRIQTHFRQIDSDSDEVKVEGRLLIHQGPFVRISEIHFDTDVTVRRSVLDRHVGLHPGDPLDILRVQNSRRRMARLRTFERVDVDVETEGEERAIRYRMEPRPLWTVSLLGGWGSYELLRGGLVAERRNILRRGHIARATGIQSFKSTRGNLRYTLPEIFGENVDVFSESEYLRREEVSFLRSEFTQGVGVDFPLRGIGARSSVRYNYEFSRADRTDVPFGRTGRENRIASLQGSIRKDRVDNPLYPEKGYQFFSTLKVAAPGLGGDVWFQRLTSGISFHRPIFESLIFHSDLTHGVLTSYRGTARDTPFGQRFFPGGSNSIRSFFQGRASPRDENREFIGAETFSLLTIQLQQKLTEDFSLNLFSDNLLQARDVDDYPGEDTLHSLGLGLSYRTLIGPLRLEYAQNLNPRPDDRNWALHFSVGSPF